MAQALEKDALEYLVGLGEDIVAPEVIEICGRTYATKSLVRYDQKPMASSVGASTLTAMVDYINNMSDEFAGQKMMVHVKSPTEVVLMSTLDGDRKREILFQSMAEVSGFRFDSWYDQERFIMELQANFVPNEDLSILQAVAGNVEGGTTANYGDDGVTQKTTIKSGIATKADVIVPNPATLIPFRTFPEIEQPSSKFVFRIQDSRDEPSFKLLEAGGGLWKNEAIAEIKSYLAKYLPDGFVIIG